MKLSQHAAFVGSSYGTGAQRAWLSATQSPFCPEWASQRGYAILTAWNPHGKQANPRANAQAQAWLRADLAGYALQMGHNGAGQWREDTFIVTGLSLIKARALGQKYGQAAVIWGTGRRAALLWCERSVLERYWWQAAKGN